MKILILGGHGFIGSHTSNVLKMQGHEVAVLDCYHQYYTFPDYEYYPVLTQRKQLANADRVYVGKIEDQFYTDQVFNEFRPEVVIHLATYPNAKMVHRNPVDAANNMVSATANILNLCTKYKVRRLVFSSSSMAYGDFNNQIPDETVACNPLTLYGSYKLQGESMVKIWSKDYGLEYTIMRPSALYGTRDMIVRVISKMTTDALKNKTITVQGPDNKLDFSYVEDVANYFALAATHDNAKNQIFNCTRGQGRTILEAAEIIKNTLGYGKIIVKEHDSFYPNRDTLNSDKIKNYLGYNPQWNIEHGIPTYVNWLTSQSWLDHFLSKVPETSL